MVEVGIFLGVQTRYNTEVFSRRVELSFKFDGLDINSDTFNLNADQPMNQ